MPIECQTLVVQTTSRMESCASIAKYWGTVNKNAAKELRQTNLAWMEIYILSGQNSMQPTMPTKLLPQPYPIPATASWSQSGFLIKNIMKPLINAPSVIPQLILN
jgi:hypothetical protein